MNTANQATGVHIPDGRTATRQEMVAAGRAIQKFINKTEARLPNIKSHKEHNDMVVYLESLTNTYNAQIEHYRMRTRHSSLLGVMGLASP